MENFNSSNTTEPSSTGNDCNPTAVKKEMPSDVSKTSMAPEDQTSPVVNPQSGELVLVSKEYLERLQENLKDLTLKNEELKKEKDTVIEQRLQFCGVAFAYIDQLRTANEALQKDCEAYQQQVEAKENQPFPDGEMRPEKLVDRFLDAFQQIQSVEQTTRMMKMRLDLSGAQRSLIESVLLFDDWPARAAACQPGPSGLGKNSASDIDKDAEGPEDKEKDKENKQ
ncbi:hypothetical protein L596_001198 [Steinernema carpocapsae]|uniref:Uncharacterized protein n=1 Tax=Steinernema carpocapsae TaxID=34508 RepID=A0A4U8UKS9_STECR|nr:hypothetical protein L596_001198 [Steinernema carpocapsae]